MISELLLTPGQDISRVLLIGPKQSGKTSLGFRLAYEEASSGGQVLYICNKARIQKPPLDVTSSGQSGFYLPEVLANVRMKYVPSHTELRQLLAGLHCFQAPAPSMLVIDDLSLLIDPVEAIPRNDIRFLDQYLLLIALLDDTLAFMESSSPSTPIKLIVLDDCMQLLAVKGLRRYFQRILRIDRSSAGQLQMTALDQLGGKEVAALVVKDMRLHGSVIELS